jgi:hypothetical protein
MSYRAESTISQGCELGIVFKPVENAVEEIGDVAFPHFRCLKGVLSHRLFPPKNMNNIRTLNRRTRF